MPAAGAIKVVSASGALTVNFTGPSGSAPTVYSDKALTSTVSLPATVNSGASSIFYFPSPGTYQLSVKTTGGTEIAGDYGTTRPVDVESADEVATFVYDTRLGVVSSGSDSGRYTPSGGGSAVTIQKNTIGARPAASTYGVGIFKATDVNGGTGYLSDGSTWDTLTLGLSQVPASEIGSSKLTTTQAISSTTWTDLTATWASLVVPAQANPYEIELVAKILLTANGSHAGTDFVTVQLRVVDSAVATCYAEGMTYPIAVVGASDTPVGTCNDKQTVSAHAASRTYKVQGRLKAALPTNVSSCVVYAGAAEAAAGAAGQATPAVLRARLL